ncbi:MAG: TolC family protein [Prolixibacteraceae bacterium]|jgi:outer membrane protein TolC|nr:TolC family protein [Prolixibacteraceae bacterium]
MDTIKQTLLWLLFPTQLLLAQEKPGLDDCRQWARENHPVLQQKQILEDMSGLAVENHQTSYLPSLNLNGQATYQSDVTSVPISLPNISIPSVANDQYKMYIDVSQTIWDGGITKILTELEKKKLDSELQKTEVELYAVQEKVNAFFFMQLKLQQNAKALETKKETLLERQKQMEPALRNGIILASDLDQLKAELIRLEQDQLGIESSRQYCANALSILTGKPASIFAELVLPENKAESSGIIARPELELFGKQRLQLDTSSDLLKKQRNPKVFGFGQLGYGRPGLNMLADEFDSYYLVGVGMKWNIHDWKKTQREVQTIQLQKEIIENKELEFRRNISLAMEPYKEETAKLRKIMEQDVALIALQENITKSSASKLDNGTITVSDYIKDLNAEILAKIMYETHKIQLQEAIEACRTIQGQL